MIGAISRDRSAKALSYKMIVPMAYVFAFDRLRIMGRDATRRVACVAANLQQTWERDSLSSTTVQAPAILRAN
jgi:hypothetical protein